MHFRRSFVALWLLLVVFCKGGQEVPAFRSEVNLVNVAAVVRSTNGKLIKDLNRNDFEVLEDGVPQTIQFFARNTELPLGLGLIVDVSGSQEKFLQRHDHDIDTFLQAVLRPSDRAFAVCFGNHLRLVSDATGSASVILEGLKQFAKGDRHFPEIGPEEERDLGTALYDALYFSIKEKLQKSEGRRALVVFSDGEENSSEHDLLDVIQAAQNTDTMVYCIRYTEEAHHKLTARNKYGMRVLKHLSSLTGGADFDALQTPLGEIFSQIGDELRATYQIGYVSNNGHLGDGSFRKLTVRCKEPGSSVRAKRGYYAH